jgi:hypothetical protein
MQLQLKSRFQELPRFIHEALGSISPLNRERFEWIDEEVVSSITRLVEVISQYRTQHYQQRYNADYIVDALAIQVVNLMMQDAGWADPDRYLLEILETGTNLAREVLYFQFKKQGRDLHQNVIDELLNNTIDGVMRRTLGIGTQNYLPYLTASIIVATIVFEPKGGVQ